MLRVPLSLLVILMLAALPSITVGKGAHGAGAVWREKRVQVRDYTQADQWQPHIASMVTTFNALLPRRAPKLIYRPMPALPCSKVPRMKGVITICSGDTVDTFTASVVREHELQSAKITLQAWEFVGDPSPSICHELLHAVTDMKDAPGLPREDTSCVQGRLLTPGAFDVRYMRWVYGKYDAPKKKG